ncbi:unnamed protein product, partial [Laminaria digitata]
REGRGGGGGGRGGGGGEWGGGGGGGGSEMLTFCAAFFARGLGGEVRGFPSGGGGSGGGGGSRGMDGGGGGGGASGLLSSLTAEQRAIVLSDVKAGEVLTVLAFAGTGKTTCLRAYAQARPHLRILYLTFNVSVREEAEKTFPPHADCKGVHQLAFRHTGRRFQSKLVQDLKEADVQSFLKTALGKKGRRRKRRGSSPGDPELVSPPGEGQKRPPPVDADTVLAWAKVCWTSMHGGGGGGDSGGGSKGGDGGWGEGRSLGMTHAGYLKLFQ